MTKSIFTQTRWLVTIILLVCLGVGSTWGAGSITVTSSAITLPRGSTTVAKGDWMTATGKSQGYWSEDVTVDSYGSITCSNAGDNNSDDLLQLKKNGGSISTTINSSAGVDIVIGYKKGAKGTLTVTLSGASAQTPSSTSWNTCSISTTTTAATLTITKSGDNIASISYITITPKAGASCSADPSATGDASINGSFTLTSLTDAVSVSSGTWGPGSNCSWTDYGFVWGTSSSLSTDNNKVQVGTSGNATSWETDNSHKVQPSGSTNPTSWSVGETYYVKAYGKNGKDGAAFYYSTNAASFTLRSITYNSNGGSTVNTQYVNSGGTYSEPSAPTKDGYTFSNWCTNPTLTADMDWTAAISENKSLYAKWTANPYTISLDNQSATTPGDASISVTYDSNTNLTGTPAITVPKKTGYTFGGYYTSTGGSGDQIIDADGNVVASVSGYTSATKQWIYAGDKTLYAKWTIKNYTITWKVNGETWTPKTTTGEGTDGSDKANYNTAWSTLTLPTDPGASELTSCVADKFMGWTESENYESDDSAPTDLLNSSNKASKTSKKITKNTTFYAVFADYGE